MLLIYYGDEAGGVYWNTTALALLYYHHYLQYGDTASAIYLYQYYQNQAITLYISYS